MILVVNSGSSSIKFKLFDIKNEPVAILDGLAERISIDNGRLKFEHHEQKYLYETELKDHESTIQLILDKLIELKIIANVEEITAVGFRVVHGGKISKSSVIDQNLLEQIKENVKLAPLHNPGAIVAIEAVSKLMPKAKLVACFDTAFHQTMPEINYLYTTPYKWYEKHNVRKYGFHGISYQYITSKCENIFNKKSENLNLIICHLGNGASICCVKNGQSYDTSMGLTPLSGLMMGTRSGDVDPSIIEYMAKELNTDVFEITKALNKESGLLGMSTISADMRDVEQAYQNHDPKAIVAIEKYTQTVADFIVKYANYLDDIDGIVFTAGVGENGSLIRDLIIQKLRLLKVELDKVKNQTKYDDFNLISTNNSQLPVYAIRTNEEKMICLDTLNLTK
ncbi:acetate kinase [Mycoplasma putrefaciens]|uniref:Acetate kinase n=1 Tax=Mycoplasma putrefaciens Mput9231 TaxID=1292033 RepID=M9WGS6_9MOLU|nr:acetate kinase [Mycoplasma putrefaciens]AGJ90604.1 Acetate kinase [Mycoplasma putrefaciens Mput9231]